MLLAETVTKIYSLDLSEYPRWLVVMGATVLAALAVWVLMKILKLALWLLFFAILIGGFAWGLWLLLQ